MKKFKAISLFLFCCLFLSCFTNLVDIKQYSIKGHLINVNNPLKFAGMHMYLESRTYSIGQGTVIKTIAETIVSDSGRFILVYDSNPATGVTIKCQEMNDFSALVSSNLDMSQNFYLADSATIVIKVISNSPLTLNDTLIISNYNKFRINLLGPLPNKYDLKFRTKNEKGVLFTWGRGLNDLIKNGPRREIPIPTIGDPFSDTVILNY